MSEENIIQITEEQTLEMTRHSGTFRKALLDEWKEEGFIKSKLVIAKEEYYDYWEQHPEETYSRESTILLVRYKDELEKALKEKSE